MIFANEVFGFLITLLTDKPTRRFLNQKTQSKLDDAGMTLDERRETPCPVTIDAKPAVGNPGGC